MDLELLLTSAYYFDKNPGGDFLWGFGLLVFFFLVVFSGKIFFSFAKGDKYLKKSGKKRFGKFVFLGVAGIVFTAARMSAIPLFSMRIFLVLILTLTLVLLFLTGKKIFKDYMKRRESLRKVGKL